MRSNIPNVTGSFRWLITTIILCMCAVGVMAQPASKSAGNSAHAVARVDVNSASLQSLETLPGVGPIVAKRIREGRPYNNLEDLERVKGLGKARIEDLRGKVSFGPANEAQTESALRPTGRSSAALGSEKLAPGQQLNINTATVQDLEKLPGIGPAKAQAIVDYRTQNGSFKSPEDIEKVKGIKAGVFSRIKDFIKVRD